jgi:integrase/recombinase XerD
MKNALSSFFTFLFKVCHITKDPTITWQSIRVPDEMGRKILERDQVLRMIECETNIRNKLIIKTLYMTGLRVSELCGLKVQDVKGKDDKRMVLHVLGKGTKVRSVLFPLSLWQEVRDNLLNQEGVGREQDAPLFRSRKAPYNRLDSSQIFRIIKLAAIRAKVYPLPSPHWFRHTSATHAIENGAPLHVVQRTLGHESIATTGRYLDARPSESNSDYLDDLNDQAF